jgi:hypothetical protein
MWSAGSDHGAVDGMKGRAIWRAHVDSQIVEGDADLGCMVGVQRGLRTVAYEEGPVGPDEDRALSRE